MIGVMRYVLFVKQRVALLCCDGCKQAFHLGCIGMAGNDIPESWFCRECSNRLVSYIHVLSPQIYPVPCAFFGQYILLHPFITHAHLTLPRSLHPLSHQHRCFAYREYCRANHLVMCAMPQCNKYYRKNAQLFGEDVNCDACEVEFVQVIHVEETANGDPRIFCPLHRCATCKGNVKSDDPQASFCFRCPTAYHKECRPADVHILGESLFLCMGHLKDRNPPSIESVLKERHQKRAASLEKSSQEAHIRAFYMIKPMVDSKYVENHDLVSGVTGRRLDVELREMRSGTEPHSEVSEQTNENPFASYPWNGVEEALGPSEGGGTFPGTKKKLTRIPKRAIAVRERLLFVSNTPGEEAIAQPNRKRERGQADEFAHALWPLVLPPHLTCHIICCFDLIDSIFVLL